eukprot:gene12739-3466_t
MEAEDFIRFKEDERTRRAKNSSCLSNPVVTVTVSCILSTAIGFLIASMSHKVDLNSFMNIAQTKYNGLFGYEKKSSFKNALIVSLLDQPHHHSEGLAQKKNFNIIIASTSLEKRETGVGTTAVPLHPEANAALKLAAQMKAQGRKEKARKLLKQCKSLSPHHPDVLNDYGEAVEDDDVVDAEHHYALALVFNPGHVKAMKNRIRTLPLVKQRDMDMLSRIEVKREALMQIPEGNAALQRAKMEAYYKHIYHSNAIEGNTMTLSMTRAIVESGIAIGGKSVMEHNEVIGLDAALKYMNTTLLPRVGNIGVKDIIELHRRVLGHVDPLEAGIFRKTQVYVGDHVPPHPSDVDRLMQDFDNWLYSREAGLLHPIELASLAHYKLVHIHPFTDGNGRTSRLLMNLFLMQAGYPPVIVRKEQRFDYYDYLQQGNLGDIRPFIRFVARCTEHTLDEFLSAVTIYPAKSRYRRIVDNHKPADMDTLRSYKQENGEEDSENGVCINPAQHRQCLYTNLQQCRIKA